MRSPIADAPSGAEILERPERGADGRFLPGHEKRAGRKAGTPNKVSQHTLEKLGQILTEEEFWQALRKHLLSGKANYVLRYMLERFAGKAKDTLEIQHEDSEEYDYSRLSTEQLKTLQELLSLCKVDVESTSG